MITTLYILLVASITSTAVGTGMVVANLDATSIGILISAVSSLVAAIVAGVCMVLNTRSKNKIEEMKMQMELQRVQMEAQRNLSTLNNTAINSLHHAVTQNTVETVKASTATDQIKQQVETLQKAVEERPIRQSETEIPPT